MGIRRFYRKGGGAFGAVALLATSLAFISPASAQEAAIPVYPGNLGVWSLYAASTTNPLNPSSPAGFVSETDDDHPGSADLTNAANEVVDLGTSAFDGVAINDVSLAYKVALGSELFRLTIRVDADCDVYFYPPVNPDWDTIAPLGMAHWSLAACGGDDAKDLAWDEVVTALGEVVPESGTPAGLTLANGFRITNGDTSSSGFSTVFVDSVSVNGSAYSFQTPTITSDVETSDVIAGETVALDLAVTLSGPNGPVAENSLNPFTSSNGPTSSAIVTVTSPEGACTTESSVPVQFAPDDGTDGNAVPLERPESNPVAITQQMPVTIETAFGIAGTCVVSLTEPENATLGEPIAFSFSVVVLPLELPDAVPADTGSLTVDPDCVSAGGTITATAPAGSFTPNSPVSLGLYGSLIDLGVATADSSGGLQIEVTVPTGVLDGQQELLAVGYGSTVDNTPVYLSADLEVSSCSGASPGVPSGIPAGVGGAEDGKGLFGTGLGIVLAVGGFLALRLRRSLRV